MKSLDYNTPIHSKTAKKRVFAMCMSPVRIQTPKTNLNLFNRFTQSFIEVPCGKCDECRTQHATMWSIRCMCEYYSLSQIQRERSWFITLTYDDDHNPGCVVPDHVTKFIHDLRNKYRKLKMRYFYCGEYGTHTLRPHYHMIIYNLPINDLEHYSKTLYTSKELEQIWSRGMIKIGFITLQSAAYVAKYALKKNETDCFIRMSNGIGKKYFLDHMKQIISENGIWLPRGDKNVKFSIPRYFLKLYRKEVGDWEYEKFAKWRQRFIKQREEKIEKHFKGEVDHIDYLLMRRLGLRSAAIKREAKNRRLLHEAKRKLDLIRDFDV